MGGSREGKRRGNVIQMRGSAPQGPACTVQMLISHGSHWPNLGQEAEVWAHGIQDDLLG